MSVVKCLNGKCTGTIVNHKKCELCNVETIPTCTEESNMDIHESEREEHGVSDGYESHICNKCNGEIKESIESNDGSIKCLSVKTIEFLHEYDAFTSDQEDEYYEMIDRQTSIGREIRELMEKYKIGLDGLFIKPNVGGKLKRVVKSSSEEVELIAKNDEKKYRAFAREMNVVITEYRQKYYNVFKSSNIDCAVEEMYKWFENAHCVDKTEALGYFAKAIEHLENWVDNSYGWETMD